MSNNKIKVLHTIRMGQIGGGEIHVLDLVSMMNPDEFEPVVLSFRDGPIVKKLRNAGISTYVVDTLTPFHLATFNNVQAILRSENISILHAHGTRALSNTLFPAKAMGIPVVYTVHGWSFSNEQKFPVNKMRELSERLLISKADVTVNVSGSLYHEGIHRFPMKRSMIITYGVNLDHFSPNRPLRNVRKELGMEDNCTNVCFIGRMTADKDPFTLIKAAAYIRQTNTDMRFIMIGEGPLKETAMQMTKELHVDDMFCFHGNRNDIPEILKSSDIFCLPSRREHHPVSILQAMAMRKPIIAADSGEVRTVLKNDFNGLLFPTGDHQQLALCLLRMHHHNELCEQLSDRAHQSVRKGHDLKIMVGHYEQLYKSMMQKRISA